MAAAAARARASSSELPAPSPSKSFPLYTPTTKTGCLLSRPVSEIRRATGASKPSRAHKRERSRVGVRKSNIPERSRCRLRMWFLKKRLTRGVPRCRCSDPTSARTKDCAASCIGTGVAVSECGFGGALSEPNSSVATIRCVFVTFHFHGTCCLNAAGRPSPDFSRLNCNSPGSTSPPGSAAASIPHSLAIMARALGPTYAFCAAKSTSVGNRG